MVSIIRFLDLLGSRMVNFNSDAAVERDFSAFAFASGSDSVNLGRPNELLSQTWGSSTFGISHMGFSCGCVLLRPSPPLISASSWEYITTLDYEWDFIRGRRPYRWTIWVCNDALFSASYFSSEIYPKFPFW